MVAPKVTGLWVYPIKSCAGIQVEATQVQATGLPCDRQWCIVRASDGMFVTQREVPQLCLIRTALPAEALLGAWGELQPGAALVLDAPGMPQLQVPLVPPAAGGAQPQLRSVEVWGWRGAAADEGEAAAEWLSTYLGASVRLVRHLHGSGLPDTVRGAAAEFAAGHAIKFADGFPLLVATEEALADLNARLPGGPGELHMDRFRPNIVLAGSGPAWADDGWRRVSVGGAALAYVKPCSRCKVTTVDQATAQGGKEPLAALASFRRGRQLGWTRPGLGGAVFFAWNAAVLAEGRVAVGDELAVLESGTFA